jgi:hypothetical protein
MNKKTKGILISIVGLILLSYGFIKMFLIGPHVSIPSLTEYPMIVNGTEFIILGVGFLIGGYFVVKEKNNKAKYLKRKDYLKHY